jgi:hypothetical protein
MMPITAKAVTASFHVISTCSRRIVLLPPALLQSPWIVSSSLHLCRGSIGPADSVAVITRCLQHLPRPRARQAASALAIGPWARSPVHDRPEGQGGRSPLSAGDSKRHANARRGRMHAWPARRLSLAAAPAPGSDVPRPVLSLPRRCVQMSADRQPSVRKSDATGEVRQHLMACSPAKPQAWGPWPRRGTHGTLIALTPRRTLV